MLSESPTAQRGGETAHVYPQVAGVKQRFLSAPATSVLSERLFSAAGLAHVPCESK